MDLIPRLFRLIARQHQWSYDGCKAIVGAILGQFYLRRTMHTTMTLPDGTEDSPGRELKGARFTTVETHLSDEGAESTRRGTATSRTRCTPSRTMRKTSSAGGPNPRTRQA